MTCRSSDNTARQHGPSTLGARYTLPVNTGSVQTRCPRHHNIWLRRDAQNVPQSLYERRASKEVTAAAAAESGVCTDAGRYYRRAAAAAAAAASYK